MNSQPPTKGSLEELFRQHLLESEAAAVPPRPLVWEQLDNSLLQAQNENYRRRLLVHRWAVAASLLLALLAGGGWWHSQRPTTAGLATATPPGAPTPTLAAQAAGGGRGALNQPGIAPQGLGQQPAATPAAGARAANGQPAPAGYAAGRPALADNETAPNLSAAGEQGRARTWPAILDAAERDQAGASRATMVGGRLASAVGLAGNVAVAANTRSAAANSTSLRSAAFTSPTATQPIAATAIFSQVFIYQGFAATRQAGADAAAEALLASRLAALPAAPSAGLPTTLALVEVPERPVAKLQRWQFEGEYAATAFQPNVDFSSAAGSSTPPQTYSTADFTRGAAAEYRANLRAGLGQRLGLRATRWLGGHWSLSTGLEAAQQQATSATSTDFVGAPLAASNASAAPRVLRASSYRYRSAGIPVELRYGNPLKTGLSLYGRVGAIVSALLNVRSEVAGSPEATRTYSLTSANSPYRRVSATVRGGAGVQYRPAHRRWALNVGPTAEAGVQSLNTDPSQSFWSQQRPYSFGLEAGLELGRGLRDQ